MLLQSLKYAVNPCGPWSSVRSAVLAAKSAFNIFAATALECLGKRLFIDALDQELFVAEMGMGGCFHILRIRRLQSMTI